VAQINLGRLFRQVGLEVDLVEDCRCTVPVVQWQRARNVTQGRSSLHPTLYLTATLAGPSAIPVVPSSFGVRADQGHG
jgi:hypothetical protein